MTSNPRRLEFRSLRAVGVLLLPPPIPPVTRRPWLWIKLPRWPRNPALANFGCYASGKLVPDSTAAGNVRNFRPQHFPRHRFSQLGFLGGKELEIRGTVRRAIPRRIFQRSQSSEFRQSVWRAKRMGAQRSVHGIIRLLLRHTRRRRFQSRYRIRWKPRDPARAEAEFLVQKGPELIRPFIFCQHSTTFEPTGSFR